MQNSHDQDSSITAAGRTTRIAWPLAFATLIIVSCINCILVSAAESDKQPVEVEKATSNNKESISPFVDSEFVRPYLANEECREFARRALVNWRNGDFGAAEVNCRQAGKLLKSKGKAWQALFDQARSMVQNGQRAKGVIMYLIGYEGCYQTGALTADDTSKALFAIANLCNRRDSTTAEIKFADKFYEQAIQIRGMSGGLEVSDAANVLSYARAEIALRKWESAKSLLEKWRALFTVLGKDPPNNQLPDALAQLGLCCNAEKKFNQAEDYFRQAVDAARNSGGGTITQLGHIDVSVLLIYALIDQMKMAEARNLARDYLSEREKQVGVNSEEIGRLLNELADKFDRAGQLAFAAELKRRSKLLVPSD